MKHNNTITVEGYTFTKYTDGTEVYFVSPITGELIQMTKPYTFEQYTTTLTNHIRELTNWFPN